MSELISVTNGIQTLKIHPSTLKAHERAGWKVVPDKAAPAEATKTVEKEVKVKVAEEKDKAAPAKKA